MNPSKLTKSQAKIFEKEWTKSGIQSSLIVTVRHDDSCGNGHNTFSVTGDLSEDGEWVAGGCMHEEVAKHFPELKPAIKFHLCSTDGPTHYLENTLYHASDKDCWGRRKGEPSATKESITFGDNPIQHTFKSDRFVEFLKEYGPSSNYDYEILEIHHDKRKFGPQYTFGGYDAEWHQCPFDSLDEAENFLYALQKCSPRFKTAVVLRSEGKEPELESARSAAIWPEATLQQLQSEQALTDRLPSLMEEFRAVVKALGFTY